MSEKELIEGCIKGNPKSQRSLYTIYAPKMLGVCYRYVNNREIAQDILQEGFIKVFSKINSYSGQGVFAGWLRKIFVTSALEYLRKNDLMRFSVSIEEYENITDEVNTSALSQLSAEELMTCVTKLPPGYRTVFNLYAIEGYSHSEIANILNIKENTSQSQLLRARKLLQKNVHAIMRYKSMK